jgi:predicted porin
MKKTLIAAGIAAVIAAPAAMADVTVSGKVKMTYLAAENGNTFTQFDNALSFKASEDLGNGLSAFAEITLDADNMLSSADATAANHKDQKVGMKGAFGTVVTGRMETLTEGVVSARFDDGAKDHAAGDQTESGLTKLGRANAIAYISPTINGFHAAVAIVDSAADSSLSETGKDYALFYDNGPLSIAASRFDAYAGSSSDIDQVVASYTMGDAKISVGMVDKGSNDDLLASLNYKLGGGNSLFVGYRDSDTASGTADQTAVKLTHSFSKRTAVWVGYRNKDNTNDVGHAGIIHKF